MGIAISLFLGSVITLSRKRPKMEHPLLEMHRQRIVWVLLLLLIMMPLCTVATYTWFSISRTPKVSDMEMTINCNSGLQIAWSADAPAEEWGQHLSFLDAVPQKTLLTPVTWVDSEDAFYTTLYGYDGRTFDLDRKLSDETDANTDKGCYVTFSFYGRTDEHTDISLAHAGTDPDGRQLTGTYLMGTPLWDDKKICHYDGGLGSQNAVRMGLRITKLDKEGKEGDSTFFIYEPNSDLHADGTRGYVPTPSADGSEHLVSEDRLLVQSASFWNERDPVLRDDVRWHVGEFEKDTFLLDLKADEMVRFDVYLWLESTDVDCVNTVIRGAQIFANLQLLAETHIHSGFEPVE